MFSKLFRRYWRLWTILKTEQKTMLIKRHFTKQTGQIKINLPYYILLFLALCNNDTILLTIFVVVVFGSKISVWRGCVAMAFSSIWLSLLNWGRREFCWKLWLLMTMGLRRNNFLLLFCSSFFPLPHHQRVATKHKHTKRTKTLENSFQ